MQFTPRLRSLFAATALAVTVAAPLTGCGYSPLYKAPDLAAGEVSAFQQVRIAEVTTSNVLKKPGERRMAQKLSQRLRQDFPGNGPTLDVLKTGIFEETTELAVQRTATVTRAQITLYADIILTSPEGKVLLSTRLFTSAPYNVEDTPYSTESGKTFARQVAATNLAEEISRRLVLYYRQHGLPPQE